MEKFLKILLVLKKVNQRHIPIQLRICKIVGDAVDSTETAVQCQADMNNSQSVIMPMISAFITMGSLTEFIEASFDLSGCSLVGRSLCFLFEGSCPLFTQLVLTPLIMV